jgi:UPF0042 nucleotide-binding protein
MAVVTINPFLILGSGGSGLTTALDIYGDFGFLTIAGTDPAHLRETLLPLLSQPEPVALSLRVMPHTDAKALQEAITQLKQEIPTLRVLTLDAPEDVLVTRYLESEKPHRFEAEVTGGLQAAVAAEKKRFTPLKDAMKDYSIDTSTTTPAELRHKVAKILGKPIENLDFTVYLNTFGFKYGIPLDAELVFDMRFMVNPFYDESLRPLTGKDKPVRDFIFNLAHSRNFFDKWADLVADMLPLYRAEGKTRLTIAIGCTGGKHRSVCMGEELAQYLKQHAPDFKVVINHREMLRWGKAAPHPQSVSPCPVGEPS